MQKIAKRIYGRFQIKSCFSKKENFFSNKLCKDAEDYFYYLLYMEHLPIQNTQIFVVPQIIVL